MSHLLVVTSYPPEGQTHGAGTVGIASYAKNTLVALRRAMDREKRGGKIMVLAEQLNRGELASYSEEGIDVHRVWQRGRIRAYRQILRAIRQQTDARTVVVEFELSMFGGLFSLVLFPLFLLSLRIRGLTVMLVLHQVVDDINTMAGHIGMKEGSLRTKVLNAAIGLFYRLSLAMVENVIVFEGYLKQKLAPFGSADRIVVIPHGVETATVPLNRAAARVHLAVKPDECVLLYFGFIAWYKGADWVVEQLPESYKLIIAGGGNPNHDDKAHYQQYIHAIETKAKQSSGNIVVTGFVAEKDIPGYFAAADLVVLPYRTFMSSSGPLSLAFTYGRPVVLSDALRPYMQTEDFAQAMAEAGISDDDLFFSLDRPFPLTWRQDSALLHRLTRFSTIMRDKRSWDRIGELYRHVLRESG